MNIVSKILETSERQSDHIAMIQDNRSITYSDLIRRTLNVASNLDKVAIRRKPVAIALSRGIDASIAIMGVLCAGGCYLPLDLKNPRDRQIKIVRNARVSFVIGMGPRPSWFQSPEKWIDIESLGNLPTISTTCCEDLDRESLACILYTSGSTGQPKGVALSHRALNNFSEWAGKKFTINSGDRIASLAPIHFDLSIFDMFTSLSSGACIYFIPDKLILTPSRLVAWLNRNSITTWYTVPSLLNFIVLKGSLKETDLKSLRTLMFAGEVIPTASLCQLSQFLPKTHLYNLFGPTETNVCSYWQVDKTRLNPDQTIPIGIAACDSELKISSSTNELLVRSDNLFSGYWNEGKLVEKIKPNCWYATGDRVSLNQDGNFLYHGRIDRMLKCSGHRVEPAEIESVIQKIPVVESCAVVGIPDPTSGHRPAAAVVLQQGNNLTDIVPAIKSYLPAYMQPAKYFVMKELPRLSNGKTDYRQIDKQLGANIGET